MTKLTRIRIQPSRKTGSNIEVKTDPTLERQSGSLTFGFNKNDNKHLIIILHYTYGQKSGRWGSLAEKLSLPFPPDSNGRVEINFDREGSLQKTTKLKNIASYYQTPLKQWLDMPPPPQKKTIQHFFSKALIEFTKVFKSSIYVHLFFFQQILSFWMLKIPTPPI